ncbi:hypothetical protein TRVA0_037S00628 [Trichomonascus vanleenenianus]|uniref:transcription factor TFIIIC subunit TFC8 n=1 Tax=Trichomonascus vanleenenianus TaxID=2268995 RepID=UPI003ECA0F30
MGVRELKLDRKDIGVVTGAIKWSEDGDIALNCHGHISILTPSPKISESSSGRPDEEYNISMTETIELGDNSFLSNLERKGDEVTTITRTTSDYMFTDLAWSPAGMSELSRCYLAALTSRGEVFLYSLASNPAAKRWSRYLDLTTQLIEDLPITDPVDNHSEKLLRAHSIAWSRTCPWSDQKWGKSFLALAVETGEIVLYSCDRRNGLQFVGQHQGFAGEANGKFGTYITGMEWSAWKFENEEATMVKSLLAIEHRNEVAVKEVTYDFTANKLSISTKSMTLIPPSRFSFSSMAWKYDSSAQQFVLAVQRTGLLNVFSLKDELDNPRAAEIRVPYLETTADVIIEATPNSGTYCVISVSSKGAVYACEFDSASGTAKEVSENPLTHHFMRLRRQAEMPSELDTLEIRVFGAILHPHESYKAIAYNVTPGNSLKYTITSDMNKRIKFFPVQHPQFGSQSLPQIWSPLNGSTLSNWWEINVLKKFLPKPERPVVHEKLMGYLRSALDEIESDDVKENLLYLPGESLRNELERVLLYNPLFDRLRLLGHYHEDTSKFMLHALADMVLQYYHSSSSSEVKLTDLDKAVLQSYGHFTSNEGWKYADDPESIAVNGGFFSEDFNFKEESNRLTITSTVGHKWRRCSLTLLPLLRVDNLTCDGCNRKTINLATLEEYGDILRILAETLDLCIYCGARNYKR